MRCHKVRGEHQFALFTAAWILSDAFSAPDQQMTDAARRQQRKRPFLWHVALTVTYMHLSGEFERLGITHLDPFTRASQVVGCVTRRLRG